MSGSAEDRDLAAAEYVLGTLDAEAARALERGARADPDLAAAIAWWEGRLSPLARLVTPVAPPAELWARIEQAAFVSVAGVPRPPLVRRAWQSLGFWRFSTAGALALAAVFAGLLVFRPASRSMYMATIAPTGTAVPVFIASVQPNGALLIRPLSPVSVAEGKSLELWALPAGATVPVALGMLPATGHRVETATNLGNETELMISLEPAGGSPTGKPTGPVMYKGMLSRVE
jgi:anti-sigma-K factor RskA